ncbi:MAG: MazG nucleotide pyrophosphohydrolase domain-containing protein [Bryobacteraceae bacterium]
MASTIQDLAELQREFDLRHGKPGNPWYQQIDATNLPVLLELTVALAGEVGEFANATKKITRGDLTFEAAKPHLASELADIFIYLLKLTSQLSIDLEGEFRSKLDLNEQRFAGYSIPQSGR